MAIQDDSILATVNSNMWIQCTIPFLVYGFISFENIAGNLEVG